MLDNEISEEGRRARFARWEQLGLDQVKHDLPNGGHRVVGGPPSVRRLAWEWVRMKEAELAKAQEKSPEVVTLKPGLYGMSVDLKEVGRRFWKRVTKA
jgi:hypothetical protein